SASRIGLPVNRRYALRASFTDEAGAVIGPATGVAWSSDNPSVAAVGQDGMVTSLDYGHARIVATAPESRRATTEVFVQGEIVVASSRSGRFQLYATERSSVSQLRKIMDDPAAATQAAFSPDGSRIAFVSTREGNQDIWLMSKDGSNQRAFTKTPQVRESSPQFLRDGSLAYLVEHKQGGRTVTQVVKADLATAQVTPLSGSNVLISQFAVSRAGELLALVGGEKNLSRVFLQ